MRAQVDQPVDVLRQAQDVDGAEIGRPGAGDDGSSGDWCARSRSRRSGRRPVTSGYFCVEGLDLGLDPVQRSLRSPTRSGCRSGRGAGSGAQAASGSQSPSGGKRRTGQKSSASDAHCHVLLTLGFDCDTRQTAYRLSALPHRLASCRLPSCRLASCRLADSDLPSCRSRPTAPRSAPC